MLIVLSTYVHGALLEKCGNADAGSRGRKIYFQMLPPVQWHFDSYVFMDMIFLQARRLNKHIGLEVSRNR
ncbi:hypothetical protein GBA52_013397 [Prunus armeniaca]|nr:hypothetical protein GBA52_013397 [Prunus armeniaca]